MIRRRSGAEPAFMPCERRPSCLVKGVFSTAEAPEEGFDLALVVTFRGCERIRWSSRSV